MNPSLSARIFLQVFVRLPPPRSGALAHPLQVAIAQLGLA